MLWPTSPTRLRREVARAFASGCLSEVSSRDRHGLTSSWWTVFSGVAVAFVLDSVVLLLMGVDSSAAPGRGEYTRFVGDESAWDPRSHTARATLDYPATSARITKWRPDSATTAKPDRSYAATSHGRCAPTVSSTALWPSACASDSTCRISSVPMPDR